MNSLESIPPLIAHRGGAHDAPENTLEAFKKAISFGSFMCEFDVQLTQDNYLVVIHDETLDRTTSGTGRVQDLVLNKIQLLDAGSWKDSKFSGARVSTLDQVMALFLDPACQTKVNIEIKTSKNSDIASRAQNKKITEALIQWLKNLKKLDPKYYSKILISSFSPEALFLVRKNFAPSELSLGYLCFIKSWDQDFLKLKNKISAELQALSCLSLNINADALTPEHIKQIKQIQANCQVPYLLAYTVNDLKTMEYLSTQGVDGVFSDCLNIFI